MDDIQIDSYDYILVCTKAMFNEIIATDIYNNRSILSDSGKIVIFQNGWGNDEPFLKYFGTDKVFNARVITGFTRPERHTSEVTVHASPVLIGNLHNQPSDAVAVLAEAINEGGIPCSVTNEIEKALWAKMLYNCTLNPLGAILGVNYGRLTESESCVDIMNTIIDEIFSVIKAGGYQTYWNDSKEYKEVFYKQLIPPTYNHRSSTLQDIERKSKTEIDTLTGSIVSLGAKLSVEVPYNKMIFNLIKTMESFF